MIQEIYIGVPNTNQYKERTIEVTDDIVQILQRIRVLLGTRKGQVLGDPDFGLNLEDYLFEMNLNAASIKKEILLQFGKYIIPGTNPMYEISVDVNFGKNPYAAYDYMIVDIYINQRKYLGVLINA